MNPKVIRRALALSLLAAAAMPAAAAAEDPPLPRQADGAKVKRFATGVGLPTQIAFSGGRAFVAGAAEGPFKGGVFVVKRGTRKAVKVPGTVGSAFGIAARGGRVLVSSGRKVIAYSRFDGKRFRRSKVIFRGGKRFNGFSGLAIGPNGRFYAGVALDQRYDDRADPGRFGNSIVSIGLAGRKPRVEAKGLRQPWMMTFARGSRSPFVSVLGQDLPQDNGAPDLIVEAAPGSSFGFPECNWLDEAACAGFDRPLVRVEAEATPEGGRAQQSPMGIGAIGDRLYVGLFAGTAEAGPQVMTMKTDGSGIEPFVTGFAAPVLSVATHRGKVYAGDMTGTIYVTDGR